MMNDIPRERQNDDGKDHRPGKQQHKKVVIQTCNFSQNKKETNVAVCAGNSHPRSHRATDSSNQQMPAPWASPNDVAKPHGTADQQSSQGTEQQTSITVNQNDADCSNLISIDIQTLNLLVGQLKQSGTTGTPHLKEIEHKIQLATKAQNKCNDAATDSSAPASSNESAAAEKHQQIEQQKMQQLQTVLKTQQQQPKQQLQDSQTQHEQQAQPQRPEQKQQPQQQFHQNSYTSQLIQGQPPPPLQPQLQQPWPIHFNMNSNGGISNAVGFNQWMHMFAPQQVHLSGPHMPHFLYHPFFAPQMPYPNNNIPFMFGAGVQFRPAGPNRYNRITEDCSSGMAVMTTSLEDDLMKGKTVMTFPDGTTVVPCRARRFPENHNFKTAYFVIPRNTKHGAALQCSHPACRRLGIKFRYCTFCGTPVAKRNFRKRHSHNEESSSSTAKEQSNKNSQQEGNNLALNDYDEEGQEHDGSVKDKEDPQVVLQTDSSEDEYDHKINSFHQNKGENYGTILNTAEVGETSFNFKKISFHEHLVQGTETEINENNGKLSRQETQQLVVQEKTGDERAENQQKFLFDKERRGMWIQLMCQRPDFSDDDGMTAWMKLVLAVSHPDATHESICLATTGCSSTIIGRNDMEDIALAKERYEQSSSGGGDKRRRNEQSHIPNNSSSESLSSSSSSCGNASFPTSSSCPTYKAKRSKRRSTSPEC